MSARKFRIPSLQLPRSPSVAGSAGGSRALPESSDVVSASAFGSQPANIGSLAALALSEPRTPGTAMSTASYQRVIVVTRLRPPRPEEMQCSAVSANAIDNEIVVRVHDKVKTFSFDHVFGPSSTQGDVYERVGRPAIEAIVSGINACIIAYGQTGAGKTYTLGELQNGAEGIIPRAMSDLFERLNREQLEFTHPAPFQVRVSYLQIYMETIHDLLHQTLSGRNLKIRESSGRVFVDGLSEHQVRSKEQVMALLQYGSKAKAVAATKMNQKSSRSHTVFTVVVEKHLSDKTVQRAQFMCVDLAGSERASKTLPEGQLFEEAKSINLSLSALGNVIAALAEDGSGGPPHMHSFEPGPAPASPAAFLGLPAAASASSASPSSSFIPWRDSKLTRLLQDVVGGNAKTTLVVNIGPSDDNVQESLTSLLFGQRAAKVRVHPVVNTEMDYKALCRKLQAKLDARVDEDLIRQVEYYKDAYVREKARADKLESQLRMLSVLSPNGPAVLAAGGTADDVDDLLAENAAVAPAPVTMVATTMRGVGMPPGRGGDRAPAARYSGHPLEHLLQQQQRLDESVFREDRISPEAGGGGISLAAPRGNSTSEGSAADMVGTAHRPRTAGLPVIGGGQQHEYIYLQEDLREKQTEVMHLRKKVSNLEERNESLTQQLSLTEGSAKTLEDTVRLLREEGDQKAHAVASMRSLHESLSRLHALSDYLCKENVISMSVFPETIIGENVVLSSNVTLSVSRLELILLYLLRQWMVRDIVIEYLWEEVCLCGVLPDTSPNLLGIPPLRSLDDWNIIQRHTLQILNIRQEFLTEGCPKLMSLQFVEQSHQQRISQASQAVQAALSSLRNKLAEQQEEQKSLREKLELAKTREMTVLADMRQELGQMESVSDKLVESENRVGRLQQEVVHLNMLLDQLRSENQFLEDRLITLTSKYGISATFHGGNPATNGSSSINRTGSASLASSSIQGRISGDFGGSGEGGDASLATASPSLRTGVVPDGPMSHHLVSVDQRQVSGREESRLQRSWEEQKLRTRISILEKALSENDPTGKWMFEEYGAGAAGGGDASYGPGGSSSSSASSSFSSTGDVLASSAMDPDDAPARSSSLLYGRSSGYPRMLNDRPGDTLSGQSTWGADGRRTAAERGLLLLQQPDMPEEEQNLDIYRDHQRSEGASATRGGRGAAAALPELTRVRDFLRQRKLERDAARSQSLST